MGTFQGTGDSQPLKKSPGAVTPNSGKGSFDGTGDKQPLPKSDTFNPFGSAAKGGTFAGTGDKIELSRSPVKAHADMSARAMKVSKDLG